VPWRETSVMDERIAFVADYLSGGFTMTELCVRYHISRPTGYALVARYQTDGPLGLVARSRRPHTSPTATPTALTTAIVALRRRHPDWGPVKLRDRLGLRAPDQPWPAASTIGALLTREGLVSARRRRRKIPSAGRPTTTPETPNALWSIDFKGEFRTRDGHWCYPLTVMDGCSRYLLACAALPHPRLPPTRAVLERLFREYGLPARIRSDNGHPFAAPRALARLSRLAVWWIRLGIVPELTQPGCPSQNGRHERMHRTLKRATTRPPASTRIAQQRRFRSFVREYNEDRPHAALGGLTPSMIYAPSTRPWSGRVPPVTYPGHFDVRRVNGSGAMKWHNRIVSVSLVLAGEPIGLEERADGEWAVYFGPVRLGILDERLGRIQPVSHDHGGALAAEGGSR
jgi:putative transposase